jgi:hypothetical protein
MLKNLNEDEDPFATPSYSDASALSGAAPTNDPLTASFDVPGLTPPAGDAGASSGADATTGQGIDEQNPTASPTPSSINPTTGTLMGSTPTQQEPAAGELSASGGSDAPDAKYTDMLTSVQQAENPQDKAVAQDALARTMYTDLKEAGHDVKWDGDQLIVDGRRYVLGDGAAPTSAQQTFTRTGPTYQPGQIDALDGFDPTAGAGGLDAQTAAAVRDLLTTPSGLDPRTVDMMKGKSREEAAALADQADEDLMRFGFASGIDDSRWLASERAANLRGRDESVIRSNRDIDITAANQQAEDRRAAIGVSQNYLALKSDNAFKTAALQGDRMALRESINQKAAELGMSADALSLEYTMGLLDDATKRYGIDIGAQIDREKLAQAGTQFQQELMFKFAQLEQLDDQFAAEYGLNLAQFGANEDQRQFDNSLKLFGE